MDQCGINNIFGFLKLFIAKRLIHNIYKIHICKNIMGVQNKNLRYVFLIFGILTFFVFIISFTIFYTTENFSSACGCKLPLWVIIVSISSLGLFVGLITYYILNTNFAKEKVRIEKNLIKVLDILDKEDNKILNLLIENKGEINQSSLSKSLSFGKVKMSRVISRMERKGIIRKKKNGMTNKIFLNDDLRDLFLE